MKYDELITNLRKKCENMDCGNCSTCLMNEVVNVIKELTDTNVGKWIPVSEKLPEEGRYVLVAYETIAGCLCHVSMLWTYATGDYYWDGLHGINPTHWMPLPEAPKEDTDG